MPRWMKGCVLLVAVCLLSPARPGAAGGTRDDGGLVVSACSLATAVGRDVLARGGNAVDAAVATGFALAVTWPTAGNVGGGGFLLYRGAGGTAAFVDFRETAPAGAARDMYLGPDGEPVESLSRIGHLAAGVPGTVAGLALAHERYGLLPWPELLRPAIELAREGFPVSRHLARSLGRLDEWLERFPNLQTFRRPGGGQLAAGDLLANPGLAAVLERIAEGGPAGFYTGETARLIEEEMKRGGGLVTADDLQRYRAIIRAPVAGSYRGIRLLSAPPPSAGGIAIVEALNILEGFDLAAAGFLSDRAVHLLVEAEKRVFADRARHLGDPDRWPVPVDSLVSRTYAARLRAGIGETATPAGEIAAAAFPPGESPETTHYSILDGDGNAVAVTTTLNSSYGSKVVVEGCGFLLNNEMDDFSVKPGAPNLYGLTGGEANAIAPGKRMLSSMSPTMLLDGDRVLAVLGTPGGSTIITTVLQLVVGIVDFEMTAAEAVAAPRFHHQWLPDVIQYEKGAFPPDLIAALQRRGHRLVERAHTIGDAQIIVRDDRGARGAPDPRGGGTAASVD